MSDPQQEIYDRVNAASKKGRGGLGFDGPKKRAKVVEETDEAQEVVKAVLTTVSDLGPETEEQESCEQGFGGDDVDTGHGSGGGGSGGSGWAGDRPAIRHNSKMHPRNEYRNKRPDFRALAAKYDIFAPYVKLEKGHAPTIDWKDPYAVRGLTTVLLKEDFGLNWTLPINHLCPPLPNRLNYIHWLEDLLRQRVPEAFPAPLSSGNGVLGIDIGTGASVIYPLLGNRVYGWRFIGTEIDAESITAARSNVDSNGMGSNITILPVKPGEYLLPVFATLSPTTTVDFCMCNPPFFGDVSEACSNPATGTVGTDTELATTGGEAEFVNGIINDSAKLRTRVVWYSTMVGKKSTLSAAATALSALGVTCLRTTTFFQGKTIRWGLAWSFYPSASFTSALPTDKPEDADKHAKSFTMEGITLSELCARINQCLTERHVEFTMVQSNPSHVTFKCFATHTPKPSPTEATDSDAMPVPKPTTAPPIADHGFRFVVDVNVKDVSGGSSVSFGVKTRFLAGLNRTMESFWHIADAVEADVRRVNRAWRRRLARAGGTDSKTADADTSMSSTK